MRAVVTVTGKDRKGIIAKISAFLSEKNANIEDISQTILGEYFAMIMIVDISNATEEPCPFWQRNARSSVKK